MTEVKKKNDMSVALSYVLGEPAPIIVASGRGEIARLIEKIAREYNIKIVKDAHLAAVLTGCEIGECIPESTYEALAAIFAFLEKEKV